MRSLSPWDTLDPDAVVMRHESPQGTLTIYRRGSAFVCSTLATHTTENLNVVVEQCFKNKGKPINLERGEQLRDMFVHDLCTECDYWKLDQKSLRKRARRRLHSAPAVTSSESIKLPSHVDVEAVIAHSFRKVCGDGRSQLIFGKAEEREDPSAAKMKEAYESLLKREQSYVKDELEPFLEYHDMTELRRKENLHKKWAEHVAEPIRREIDQQMHSRRLPALERRRQQLYDDYLTHVNKKGHVFLDVIAPDEYYAMANQAMQPFLLKAKTKRLRDPTIAQYRTRNDEDRVEMRCLSGSFLTDKDIEQIRLPPIPLVPLGRKGVDANSWVRMPLVDIDSPQRRASRYRMHSSGTRSSIDFEAWSRTPFSRVIVDAELQLQKKRHFPHPHAPQPQKAPARQPCPHLPHYQPQFQDAVEPQPSVVEPPPSAVEPMVEQQPSAVEPIVGPQPSTVASELAVQATQPRPQPTHVPQPHQPMEKPQAQLSVAQPQPSAFEPHIHTQPQTAATVPSALIPSTSYIIAC